MSEPGPPLGVALPFNSGLSEEAMEREPGRGEGAGVGGDIALFIAKPGGGCEAALLALLPLRCTKPAEGDLVVVTPDFGRS